MTILPQYPHYLYKEVTPESERSDDGSYSAVEPSFEYVGTCRQEPSGGASTVATEDGRTFICTSMVYAPVGTPKVDVGTRILVRADQNDDPLATEGMLVCGDCKRTDVGRLHTRIWM